MIAKLNKCNGCSHSAKDFTVSEYTTLMLFIHYESIQKELFPCTYMKTSTSVHGV